MKESYYIDIFGVWRIEEQHLRKPKKFTYELNCCVKGIVIKNLVNYDKEIFELALAEMNKV